MAMTISYISVSGGRVCVETEGNGPLIVCSPAMGDARDAFAPFSSLLAEAGFRVARADLRGPGDSSTDFAAYGDEATAKDLLAVIEKFGGGPAILAGASMSAAAAVIAAGMEPAKVSGLVLLGPFLRGTSTPLQRLGFRLPPPRRSGGSTQRSSGLGSAITHHNVLRIFPRPSNAKAIGPPSRRPLGLITPSSPPGSIM